MNEEIEKRVFISATYKHEKDCIEEVKSKFAELGIKAFHFKDGHFYDGRIAVHSHDRCIELVKEIPNYLLIVNYRAGSPYEGNNEDYQGLTITHAEFRAALEVFNDGRRLFPFVRKEVWDFYNTWKDPIEKGRVPVSWEIEENLFPLLEDIANNIPWTDTFETSLDLKKKLAEKEEEDYFV